MSVTIRCSKCQSLIDVVLNWLGMTVQCPICQGVVVVPALSGPRPAPPTFTLPLSGPSFTPPQGPPTDGARFTSLPIKRKPKNRRLIWTVVGALSVLGLTAWGTLTWLNHQITVVSWRTTDSLPGIGFGNRLKPTEKGSKFLAITLQIPSRRFCRFVNQKIEPVLMLTDLKVLLQHEGKALVLPAAGAQVALLDVAPDMQESLSRTDASVGSSFRPSELVAQTISVDNQPVDQGQPVRVSFFVLADTAAVTSAAKMHVQVADDHPFLLTADKRE